MPRSLLSERTVATPALRFWRLSVGYSQTDLATESGVSASTIRRLEQGRRTTPANVQQLTAFLRRQARECVVWFLTDYASQDEPHTLDLSAPLTPEQARFVETQA